MTQTATTSAPPQPPADTATPPAPGLVDALLRCWLMIGLGGLIVGAALWDFRIAQEFAFLRTPCLISEIIAGCGGAWCFGGAMHYLDAALATHCLWDPIAWYWRGLFLVQKRVLMLCQLALIALALAALGVMLFDWKIPPGPDRSFLNRSAVTPAMEP